MIAIFVFGFLVISGIGVVFFAAYKINAQSFEFSAAIWRLVSFNITIRSSRSQADEGKEASRSKGSPGSTTRG